MPRAGETGDRRAIPFSVEVEHRFAEIVRIQRPAASGERVEAKMIRWPRASPDGETAVFEAFGRLWLQDLTGDAEAVALTGPEENALAPAWSPDGRRIAYATWSDDEQGAIRVVDVRGTRGGRTREA